VIQIDKEPTKLTEFKQS